MLFLAKKPEKTAKKFQWYNIFILVLYVCMRHTHIALAIVVTPKTEGLKNMEF